MDKMKVFVPAGILLIIVAFQYFNGYNKRQSDAQRIAQVNSSPQHTKGIIVKRDEKDGYKLTIKYMVGKTPYTYTGLWYDNPKNLHEGDSIRLKYSSTQPKLIITELEKDY